MILPQNGSCQRASAAKFLTPLSVETQAGAKTWVLTRPLRWSDPDGNEHVVPVGYETDFASVPKPLLGFVLSQTATAAAAVVHDYYYEVLRRGRKWADDLFWHTLRSSNISWRWATIYWLAVRLFGWWVYYRCRKHLIQAWRNVMKRTSMIVCLCSLMLPVAGCHITVEKNQTIHYEMPADATLTVAAEGAQSVSLFNGDQHGSSWTSDTQAEQAIEGKADVGVNTEGRVVP